MGVFSHNPERRNGPSLLILVALLALPLGSSWADGSTEVVRLRPDRPTRPAFSLSAPAQPPSASKPPARFAAPPRPAPPIVLPLVPSRASVREQIRSIDPADWLRRWGPVERRDLP